MKEGFHAEIIDLKEDSHARATWLWDKSQLAREETSGFAMSFGKPMIGYTILRGPRAKSRKGSIRQCKPEVKP